MSRYYDLTITTLPAPGAPVRVVKQWTSHPNGKFDPCALNIEFDIPVTGYDTPTGGQTITIEGISLSDLQQAKEFTNLNFVLKAGMKKGLPLANPKQAGVIVEGFIYQSFGKWVGTEMSLTFVINASSYNIDFPGNFVLNWAAGSSLSNAIEQTIKTVYPTVPINMNISSDLVLPNDEVGFYSSLNGLAQTIAGITAAQGHQVYITFQNGAINVFDDTYTPAPVEIQFVDLIGQPAWVQIENMQFTVVMRSDIQVGSFIKMPKGMKSGPGSTTTAGASLPSSLRYKTAFQGLFYVSDIRQLGNFRSADGSSWVTVLNCYVAGAAINE